MLFQRSALIVALASASAAAGYFVFPATHPVQSVAPAAAIILPPRVSEATKPSPMVPAPPVRPTPDPETPPPVRASAVPRLKKAIRRSAVGAPPPQTVASPEVDPRVSGLINELSNPQLTIESRLEWAEQELRKRGIDVRDRANR